MNDVPPSLVLDEVDARRVLRFLEFESPVACDMRVEPGIVIGDFRIVREIGRGGMGVVWEAEQVSLPRRVALKLLPVESRTAGKALERFRREAKAGARLNHPNVVAVYALGEHDGVPFIAQELVEGSRTLADHLAEFRRLPDVPSDYYGRMAELFVEIGSALQAAHAAKVIHRDVKPGNILMTRDGRPKLADFGLAHVEGALALSRTGDFHGTPFYMSPEQAEGQVAALDARTDVFSLGATFYEALSATRPFDGDTSREVMRKIATEDPVDPRRIRSRIPTDLAVICMKALEKRRAQRYSTMAELVADLQRHLSDQPIEARPPNLLVRSVKWSRRHPVLTASGSITLVAFALVTALWWDARAARFRAEQARAETEASLRIQAQAFAEKEEALTAEERARKDATDAADRANHEALTATRVLEMLVKLFEVSDPSEARGRTITAREILDLGVGRIRTELSAEPAIQARLLSTIGGVFMELALYEDAGSALNEALRLRREMFGGEHADTLASMNDLATLLGRAGQYAEAEPLYVDALAGCRRILGIDDRVTLSVANGLAATWCSMGRYSEAEPLMRATLNARRHVLGDDDRDTLISINNLANLLSLEGRITEAEPLFRDSAETSIRVLGEDHTQTLLALSNLAGMYYQQERYADAEPLFLRVLSARRRLLGDDHADTLVTVNSVASVLKRQGRYSESAALYRQAMDTSCRSVGPDHPNSLTFANNLALVCKLQGRYAEAEQLYRQVLDSSIRTLGADRPNTLRSSTNLAFLWYAQGRYAEADSLFRQILEARNHVLGERHTDTLGSIRALALCCWAQGQFAEAECWLHDARQKTMDTEDYRSVRHDIAEAFAALYAAWDSADPGAGKAEQSAAWKSKSIEWMDAK